LGNLEAHRADAIAATHERTCRIWRLYLAGSAQGFTHGRMALSQTLLGKCDAAGKVQIPPTRKDLYAQHAHRALKDLKERVGCVRRAKTR
jgi:cyclopropane-fatty-acyl-phospholipid synthase